MDKTDIVNRFEFHPADDRTGPMHEQVRAAIGGLAMRLNDLLPEGREKSLAITHLEESMFWSNAAIARVR